MMARAESSETIAQVLFRELGGGDMLWIMYHPEKGSD
jgi:hypothetical protein